MLELKYHKDFWKQFFKLSEKQREKAKKTIKVFEQEPFSPKLRNHSLKGEWTGFRSISVGGDLRIHYKELDNNIVLLVSIGTHAQLYK